MLFKLVGYEIIIVKLHFFSKSFSSKFLNKFFIHLILLVNFNRKTSFKKKFYKSDES